MNTDKTGTSEFFYIGTHRRAHHADPEDIAFGIYTFTNDPADNKLALTSMVETPRPGWLCLHPNGRYIYTVNEVKDFAGEMTGGVSAFAIDKTGALSLISEQVTPSLPCHCEVDASGQFLLVATFGGGSVHMYPLLADGRIAPESDSHHHSGSSVHPRRQTQPHAHAVSIDTHNRYVLVPDLGVDKLFVYKLNLESARLEACPSRTLKLPPASGPRHVNFSKTSSDFVYLMNEMNATFTSFAYDALDGALQEIGSVDLLPEGFTGLKSGAAIALHPNGKYLYATTRSHGSSGKPANPGLDNLVWFEVNQSNGQLNPAGRISSGGEIPRSFAFDQLGEHLYIGHQCSGTIVKFRVDSESGTPVVDAVTNTPVPVCITPTLRADID